jgi:hypothetical protein
VLSIEEKKFIDNSKPIIFKTKNACDSKCLNGCTKNIFVTYIILNKNTPKTSCLTAKYFVAQFENTLYFIELEKIILRSLDDKIAFE